MHMGFIFAWGNFREEDKSVIHILMRNDRCVPFHIRVCKIVLKLEHYLRTEWKRHISQWRGAHLSPSKCRTCKPFCFNIIDTIKPDQSCKNIVKVDKYNLFREWRSKRQWIWYFINVGLSQPVTPSHNIFREVLLRADGFEPTPLC